jgi:hypothetical protein
LGNLQGLGMGNNAGANAALASCYDDGAEVEAGPALAFA